MIGRELRYIGLLDIENSDISSYARVGRAMRPKMCLFIAVRGAVESPNPINWGGATMKTVTRITTILCVAVAMAGCATVVPPASVEIETYYKSVATPPPGMARIYIIPPHINTWLQDKDTAGWIYFSQNGEKYFTASFIRDNNFLALDANSSRLFIKAAGGGTTIISISPEPGKVYFIRPFFYANACSAVFGLLGCVVEALKEPQPAYESVDVPAGMAKIQTMTMSSLLPEARGLVRQEIPSSRPVTSAH